MNVLLPRWAGLKPVVGMVHLFPLPGSPRFGGSISAIREAALRDAEALAEGGVHGIIGEFRRRPVLPRPRAGTAP